MHHLTQVVQSPLFSEPPSLGLGCPQPAGFSGPIVLRLNCPQTTGPGQLSPWSELPPGSRSSSDKIWERSKSWPDKANFRLSGLCLCYSPFHQRSHTAHSVFSILQCTNCHFDKGFQLNQPLQLITSPGKVDSFFCIKFNCQILIWFQILNRYIFNGFPVVFPHIFWKMTLHRTGKSQRNA